MFTQNTLLPFLFIFNANLLLIDVEPLHAVMVFLVALTAMLVFAAGTMGYFFTRGKHWGSSALALVALILFRHGYLLDQIQSPFTETELAQIFEIAKSAKSNSDIRLRLEGMKIDGDMIASTFQLPLGEAGAEGFDRLAENAGINIDWELTSIKVENERLPKEMYYIPALLLLSLIIFIQRRRHRDLTRRFLHE